MNNSLSLGKIKNNRRTFKFSRQSCNRFVENEKQSLISELCSEYLSHSTIHGFPYLGGKNRNLLEKIWWLVGVILSISACFFAISKLWAKWENNPVIVTFAQHYTHISEIPFPAVTICPINKIKQSVFNYTAYMLNNISAKNDPDFKTFLDLQFICNNKLFNIPLEELEKTDKNFTDNIKNVAPQLFDTVLELFWDKKKINDTYSLFVEHLTDKGLCFTFNGLGTDDMYTDQMLKITEFIEPTTSRSGWSVTNGYLGKFSNSDYPKRTMQHGLKFGLLIYLYSELQERDTFCENNTAFKLLLHNPAETPRIFERYILAPANAHVLVAVTPKVIKTSKRLERVDIKTRSCYFTNEKKLRFYKIYTEFNCKSECLANLTQHICGCVPFFLPRDNYSAVCGYNKKACSKKSLNLYFNFINMEQNNIVTKDDIKKEFIDIFFNCQCYPSCDFIDYDVEVSQSQYQLSQLFHLDNLDLTPINVYFEEANFLPVERKELFGDIDFIVNIGGLLSLFLGFSILSLLEIIYYFTVRLICKIYYRNKINSTLPMSSPSIIFIH